MTTFSPDFYSKANAKSINKSDFTLYYIKLSVVSSYNSIFNPTLGMLKSTQYKKLVLNALPFTYQKLKSYKSHGKNETKNIDP